MSKNEKEIKRGRNERKEDSKIVRKNPKKREDTSRVLGGEPAIKSTLTTRGSSGQNDREISWPMKSGKGGERKKQEGREGKKGRSSN